ncbi:MAG: permease [Candidatus Aenigmatarchaeota archaeon]
MRPKEYVLLTFIAAISIAAGVFYSSQPLAAYLTSTAMESLRLMAIMAWETWWALVLGFTVAGAVEAWVSKEAIAEVLEGRGPKEVLTGSFFGFISSSCSFSAIATAKNLFKKGASAVSSLAAFMFASTNLVIEIGLVMWVLLGWQFVAANFLGGFILITVMSLMFIFLVPDDIIENARQNVIRNEGKTATDPVCGMDVDMEECDNTIEHEGKMYYFCSEHCMNNFDPEEHTERGILENMTTLKGWKTLADKQLKEWNMLYEDIIVGFVLAGIIGAFVPNQVWLSLFGGEFLGLPLFVLWTAALGAIIGVLTFVCSVGNVPFAAILWGNGLPFGSVLSYIYADLIVPPIMDAYRKYYGKKFAVILSGLIFTAAVVTGFIIHFTFLGTNLIPEATSSFVERTIELNYKAYLNVFFLPVFLALYYIHKTDTSENDHGAHI